MPTLYQKLENIVSKQFVSESLVVRHAYSRNVDPVLQGIPDIVIRPKDAKEISEILKVANEENIPITPRGGGDCEFGGSKPIGNGGIVLDMKRMNNIINLDKDNLIVTIEAGISWGKLNDYLCHFGLYTGCMGPGSGMTASVGGGISHNSSGGGGSAKYGSCTNQLVSLEVVLPTGDIKIDKSFEDNILFKVTKITLRNSGNSPTTYALSQSFSKFDSYFLKVDPEADSVREDESGVTYIWNFELKKGESVKVEHIVSYVPVAILIIVLFFLFVFFGIRITEDFSVTKEVKFSRSERGKHIKIIIHIKVVVTKPKILFRIKDFE